MKQKKIEERGKKENKNEEDRRRKLKKKWKETQRTLKAFLNNTLALREQLFGVWCFWLQIKVSKKMLFCWPCIILYQYSDWPCIILYQYSDWPCITVYRYSDWPCIILYQYSWNQRDALFVQFIKN
jgi:hypothetical protein